MILIVSRAKKKVLCWKYLFSDVAPYLKVELSPRKSRDEIMWYSSTQATHVDSIKKNIKSVSRFARLGWRVFSHAPPPVQSFHIWSFSMRIIHLTHKMHFLTNRPRYLQICKHILLIVQMSKLTTFIVLRKRGLLRVLKQKKYF